METIPTPTLLTRADEIRLARAIEAGVFAGVAEASGAASETELRAVEAAGAAAWRQLAEANVRLVWLVVMPVARRSGLDADELFQEGFLGLLEAMQRFDHERGARFATFALPWIRMRVSNAASTNHGSVGLPPRGARIWRRVRGVEAQLAVSLGRLPTDAEVARASGDSASVVRSWRAFAPAQPLPPDADVPQQPVPWPMADDSLGRLVEGLAADERAVIERRYGLGSHPPMSLVDVAAELGVSPSTVRRRERAALAFLRGRVETWAA